MNVTNRILLINVLIVIGYNLLSSVLCGLFLRVVDYNTISHMIFAAMAVIVHLGINFILSIVFFIRKDKERGKAFLLTLPLILLIGFSSCLGGIPITGLMPHLNK